MNALFFRTVAALATVVLLIAPLAGAAQDASFAPRADVLVIGGTPSGVAAALAAARRGERVTLVASGDDLGGVLTSALMDQWDRNVAPDGSMIQDGIFAEMYAQLGDAFTPAAAARTFAEMVAAEPRIAVRYDEMPVAVHATPLPDGRCIDGVSFVNARTGMPSRLTTPYVVDATDFGDVAALAGARYDVGREDTGIDDGTQAVTLVFVVTGIDLHALAAYDPRAFGPGGALDRRAWGYSKLVAAYEPSSPDVLVRDLNLGVMPDGAVTVNAIDVVGIDGLRPPDLARARSLTEREAPRLVAFLRERLPGFSHARVAAYAPNVYVRETRHVAGLERLTAADVWLGKIPDDSIGLSSYPIDVHPVDARETQAYAPVRHVYGIPFGAMVPREIDNLLIASPAISASHLAAGSARVIPTTIEEGEAAGAAAAQADRTNIDFAELATRPLAINALRHDLGTHDVVLSLPMFRLAVRTERPVRSRSAEPGRIRASPTA